MKDSNRRELQQIAINHWSDTNFDEFRRVYKKCTAKQDSFLVTGTTLPLDEALHFWRISIEMKNCSVFLIT